MATLGQAIKQQDPDLQKKIDALVLGAFGPTGDQFRGVFRDAKNRLGQEGDPNLDPNQVGGSALELGSNFAKEYYRQTGQLPDEALTKEFVGTNLDTANAQGFIKGTYGQGQQSDAARSYIEGLDPSRLPQAETPAADPTGFDARKTLLSDMIRGETEQGTQDINDQFAKIRGRTIEEAGSRGNQPLFRQNLQSIDQEQGRGLSDLIRGLRTKSAGLGFDAEQQAREFGVNTGLQQQGLNLQKKSLAQQIQAMREGQSRQDADILSQNRLAERLGKKQGEAESVGNKWADLADTGLGALGGFLIGGPVGSVAGTKTGVGLTKRGYF